jgi:predicted outer membrane repeat protein
VNTTRALTLFLALTLLGLVFLVVSAPTARAASPVIFRVTIAGTTEWPCGDQVDWSNPCALQTALSNTVSDSELWVAAGTYTPTMGVTRTASFHLVDSVALYGGFSGGETLRAQRNITTNITILSGDIGTHGDSSDNAYHVVTTSGVTNTAILDGFTIADGNANGPYPDDHGGGMCNNSGSPTLRSLTFFSNTAAYGGGMDNYDSDPTLANVTFLSNSGTYGGGIGNHGGSNPTLTNVTFISNSAFIGGGMDNYLGSSPTLINVTFTSNSAAIGGGMDIDSSYPALTNVTFSSNSATELGGGVSILSGWPTLTNVTFSSNWAGRDGGGMYNESNGSPALSNVTFTGNSASQDGGGLYNTNGSRPTLTNVTFISNTANVHGGGLYNNSGDLTLINVTISSNSASQDGGGLYNSQGKPTLTNVTFSSNSATGRGGGIYNAFGSSPTITNTTFSANSATDGGGMYNAGISPRLTSVTFSGNSATHGGGLYNPFGSPVITNAIFWGNTAPSGAQVLNDIGTPSLSDSVVQGGCPAGSTCSHIITEDPRLGPLGNWGGNTQTIPLLPGSSAIDSGDDATCAATDQRGIPRPQGAQCDIGAYESRGFGLAKGSSSGDNQSTMVIHSFSNPLRVTLSSAYGEPVDGGVVNFTAPLSGAGTSPITNTATIASGVGTQILTANGLVGSYAVTANASGATSSATFNLTNIKTDTTTTVTSSANPSVVGQSVTLTATVSGAWPTGSVAFKDGGTALAGCDSVTLNSGSAPCTVSSPALGSHSITADYSGDANNDRSSGALTQVVNKANTATSIGTHTPNPSEIGTPVTVHFSVSVTPPSAGTPSGSVTISDQTVQCTGTLTAGAGSCALTFASPGSKTLTATYSGDSNFTGSVSVGTAHIVNYPAPTLAAIAPTHGSAGGPAFTLTVTGTNFYLGSVVRWNGGDRTTGYISPTQLTASIPASDLMASGTASVTVHTPPPGGGSTSALLFAIDNSNATTSLVSSPSPSVFGQSIILTAMVTGYAPTGTVSFQEDGMAIALCQTVSLVSGQATCNTLPGNAGTHTIGAFYSGDANNDPSNGMVVHVVNKANTATIITSSANPIVVSSPVTFTARVSPIAPAGGTPTGTVELSETSTVGAGIRGTRRAVASQPLVDGVATFTLPSLTAGAHTFLATYSGDANNNASTSGTYTQNVSLFYDYLPLLRR